MVLEFLSQIVPDGSEAEIRDTIVNGVLLTKLTLRCSKEFLSYCVFSVFDVKLAVLSDQEKRDLIHVLDDVQAILAESGLEGLDWWLAEIYLKKAGLAETVLERGQKHHLWQRAYETGLASSNREVMIQAAHSLGLRYAKYAESLRELAGMQLSLVNAVSSKDSDLPRLEKIGKDLFTLWSQLDFRRLAASEIELKQALMDSAKSLAASGCSPADAAPVMVLLLCNVHGHTGTALGWAKNEVSRMKPSLPPDVQSRLAPHVLDSS